MRRLAAIALVLAASASPAHAWNPLKAAADKLAAAGRAIGGVLGAPFGGLLDSVTSPTIHDAGEVGHALIADLDGRLKEQLARAKADVAEVTGTAVAAVDHSLQARILQIQGVADHTIDHAFDRIDGVVGRLEHDAEQLLDRAAAVGQKLVRQLDDVVAKDLDRVDQLIGARLGDVQVIVASSLQQADDIARARLEQLDEMAGRRLGNLDVIATKQSLSLEAMLLRIAGLVGLVGLLGFVGWRLFREVSQVRGKHRGFRVVTWHSLRKLAPQLALAGAGALVMYGVSIWLPRPAEHRAGELVDAHRQAFDRAADAFDVIAARYHESQLELLAPAQPDGYRGRLKKVELLHALFTRPAQLHTQQGLAGLVAQIGEVDHALPGDPDIAIAKAYVLWQVGGTRDDEYEAATLCAGALVRGSVLAPLARNYVSAFLLDPYVPAQPGPSLDDLSRALRTPPGANETHQFDGVIELDVLIEHLDRASVAAYLDLLAAHADLRIALAGHATAAAHEARAARTAAANRLIAAWAAFDRALESSAGLASDATVLSVFTLDDAVLTRARYLAAVPEADELAPLLTARPVAKALTPALRARIAPLRVAWERRYAALLGPSERELVAFEESRRFAAFEQRAAAFEQAYVGFLVAARSPSAQLPALAAAAATRAAGMGLYRDTEGGRIAEAAHILAAAGGEVSAETRDTIDHHYRARRLRLL